METNTTREQDGRVAAHHPPDPQQLPLRRQAAPQRDRTLSQTRLHSPSGEAVKEQFKEFTAEWYLAIIQLLPDLSQLRLGSCLWIVLVLVRVFWVRRVGH